MHVPPLDPVYPALHRHAVDALLPAKEAEFAGQLKHIELLLAPTTVEYVLSPQLLQAYEDDL